ncbi:hypothetical protein BD414DRAFT_553953 [Trametes punicea]|nr:hypothetical protein BD414DRAFT_553953 [Trametes punicea]
MALTHSCTKVCQWAAGASHSTATMSSCMGSSGGSRGLYGLRLMHRPNIFPSRFGPRAGRAIFFMSVHSPNPNPVTIIPPLWI